MKKTFIQKTFLFIFSLFLTNALLAVPVTWTGGGANNLWSNTANWSTGTIPNAADDVTIPTGSGTIRFNYINRRVRTLIINSGSTVDILSGAKLRLIGSVVQPLFNYGTLLVRGKLILVNSINIGLANYGFLDNRGIIWMNNMTGTGLFNQGSVHNRASGEIRFLVVGGTDISTSSNPFVNEGLIQFLVGGTGTGISVGDGFENRSTGVIEFGDGHPGRLSISGTTGFNEGTINFLNSTRIGYPIYVSLNSGFRNGASGRIEIDGFTGAVGMIVLLNSLFENEGYLGVFNETGSVGLHLNGTFVNEVGASIEMIDLNIGIIFSTSGDLENHGTINMLEVTTGINTTGHITNFSEATMVFENGVNGILNYSPGVFTNTDGEVTFDNISNSDIQNFSLFYNVECGIINGDDAILNDGTFENDAWLSYPRDGNNHTGASLIVNTGIVIDPYDRFATILDNQETRVIALTNPQVNVPYPDAFDVANITGSDFADFYLDSGLNDFAGTYDYSSNTYTPNKNAVGATTLYTKAHQNCTRVFEIRIDGSIAPIVNNQPEEGWMKRQSAASQNTSATSIRNFPNPTTGVFQTQLPRFATGSYDLQVLNAQGQVIANQQGDATLGDTPTFDLSEYPAGMYWTRLLADGKLIAQEKIIRLR